MAPTIEFRNLTKTFGQTPAVTDLSFSVEPGRVTGFLGPNGAGKSTSLRCLTGLVKPTSGTALIDGREYHELADPIRRVGVAFDSGGFHPGRSGRNNLRVMALAAGVGNDAVDRVLELVGMTGAADRRVEGYSMGMRQRLAIAGALLGDPQILLLDEPANGLDPEGIAWMRSFLRARAAEGATVLISSHVLSEVQQTVDDVVIIAKGRLIRHCPLSELVSSTELRVTAKSPQVAALEAALANGVDGVKPRSMLREGDTLHIEGLPIALVGRAALQNGVELHGLSESATELEQVFLNLTGGAA